MTPQQANLAHKGRQPQCTAHENLRRGSSSSQTMIKNQDVHASRRWKTSLSESEPLDSLPRSIFVCGFLVPSQFFVPARRSHMFWRGEQRLLFAVLQDAVACWFRYRDAPTFRGRRLFGETVAWFESPDKGWLYAFERICEILDLDPDYIRRGLRDWHRTVSVPPTLSSGVRRRTVSKQPHWPA